MRKIELICIITCLLTACGQGTGTKNGSASAPGASGNASPNVRGQTTQMGTVNGGGGAGVQCGDHVEMLDVFEARQAGLTLADVPSSEKDAIQLVSERIARHYWNVQTIPLDQSTEVTAKTWIAPIFEGQPIMNPETKKQEKVEYVESLPLSNDFGKVEVPVGCNLVQIAYFLDSETQLSIVKSLRDKMDFLSKGVLAAHEVIYLVDRRDSIENLKSKDSVHTSKLTRDFIGKLFSTEPPPSKSSGVPPKGRVYRCLGISADKSGTYFYAFDSEKTGKLSLVFTAIYDHSHLYQMRSDFTGLTLNIMIDPNSEDTQEKAALKFTGLNQDTGFKVNITKQKGSEPIFELLYLDQNKKIQSGAKQTITCEKY